MEKAEAIERLEYLKAKAQIALEGEIPEWIAEDILGTIEAYDMAIEALQTENSSEKPNNCETCRFELYWPEMCEGCCEWDSHYEPKDEPKTESVGVPFALMDEATFKAHCLNCQRDVADIKCLDCDGNKYFLSYEPQTDRKMAIGKRSDATADKYNLYGKTTTDEPQTERSSE